jgi:hypothetical protein
LREASRELSLYGFVSLRDRRGKNSLKLWRVSAMGQCVDTESDLTYCRHFSPLLRDVGNPPVDAQSPVTICYPISVIGSQASRC